MIPEMERICFQIISASGMAKSSYIEAIACAKQKDFDQARHLIEQAEEYFVDAHKVHAQLISQEAGGQVVDVSLLLMHAEDQMASCELAKFFASELIDLYEQNA